MVKEGECGEVPVAHVLGDIDFCTVPLALLKTDPCSVLSWGWARAGASPSVLEGEIPRAQAELNPLNESLGPLE